MSEEELLERIDQSIRSKVRKVFKKQPTRVWYIMVSDDNWKAIVINTTTKIVLFEAPPIKAMKSAKKNLLNILDATVSGMAKLTN